MLRRAPKRTCDTVAPPPWVQRVMPSTFERNTERANLTRAEAARQVILVAQFGVCTVAFGLSRNQQPAWATISKSQQTRLGTFARTFSLTQKPAHLPRTLCPGAGGGCMSPSQPPPFERHPHPAGDEGNATAKVAPSGLGQCHVVEPESARTRPGSHDTHGQGLLERAQVWSVMRGVRVTLPLHYRYITVKLPLHCRYITVTLPLQVLHIEADQTISTDELVSQSK